MMKIYLSLLILTGFFVYNIGDAEAQVKIGTNGAIIAPSSLLELESANQGLLLPRMADTVAINALNPPSGMLIYLTKVPAVGLYVRRVSGWEFLSGSMGGNANFMSVTVSGAVTAGSFSGPLTGNATTATTATTATNSVNSAVTNDLATTAVTFPTFVTTTPGNTGLRTSNANLSYVPSTGVLTALGFRGPLTGNVTGTATLAIDATNAANTTITNDIMTNALHYPTFVSGITGALPHRTSSTNFTFNPSTGTLGALNFNGNLNGNATSATNVTGVVALVNGGTGATTKAAAFDALSPMTMAGDIIYMSPGGTGTRLPAGGTNTFLRAGATPSWSAIDLSADVTGIVPSNRGGTGVNNAFNLTLSGANISLAATAPTTLTLPTTGTLATLAGTEALTNKTINGNNITSGTGTLTLGAGSTLTTSGANPITLISIAPTNLTMPTTGTLATLNGTEALTNKTINGNTVTAGTGTLTLGAGSTLTTSNTFPITLTSTAPTNVTLPTSTPPGGALVGALSGSASINFPSISSLSSDSPTINVPGAVDGDTISLGVPTAVMIDGAAYVAWVSSPGNVTVRFINYRGTPIDPPAAIFQVKVFK